MPFPALNFCSVCSSKVAVRVPDGDTFPRHVCGNCGTIHYRNPLPVIGTVPEWKDQVLLCRRAIEPGLGLWTLPAGFMELGETTAEAALRETAEEAGARLDLGEPFSLISVPHVGQIHLFYRGRLLDVDFHPGSESLEVALFRENEIPWEALAFRTVATTLRHFYSDRKEGRFRFHTGEVPPAE